MNTATYSKDINLCCDYIILYSVMKHEQIISLASASVPTSLLAMNQTYVFLFTELTFSPNKLILSM